MPYQRLSEALVDISKRLAAEVAEPEFVVGILEMLALIAPVAVHSVRIDHKVELPAGLVHSIKELESVLMMHIIVTCTVGQLEHYRFCTSGTF